MNFDDAVTRYRGFVLATAIRVAGRFDLAEDATQEAFIALHRSFDRLERPEQQVRAWLKTTVWRLARDLRRRERLDRQRPLADAETPDPKEPRASTSLLDTEREAAALATLATLERPDRELLAASILGALTPAELAPYFELSATVLKGRLQRARERLRDAGYSLRSLLRGLATPAWPDDYSTRCRLANEARMAAEQAFALWADVTKSWDELKDPTPLEDAYARIQKSLTLDPHNARNHAVASQVCLCQAFAEHLQRLPPERAQHLGTARELVGSLTSTALAQADAHARIARRLNERDPDAAAATARLRLWMSPSFQAAPMPEILREFERAYRLGPLRIDIVCANLTAGLPVGQTPELAPLSRALRRHESEPLTQLEFMVLMNALHALVAVGRPSEAGSIAERIREEHAAAVPDAVWVRHLDLLDGRVRAASTA